MGITQISSGLYSNSNKLQLERIKTIGLHKSYSYDDLVTDSAAGATAFACGVKTYNGAIGVDADTIAVKTILEEAEDRGLRTGLVSTSSIVHATPASFIAHEPYRKNYEAIASDFREYFPIASKMATTHLNADNDAGFFLMIESSQIDWGGHANDANYIITEMIEFDKVIGEVLDFAEADGNTLVIVTADHETGGFAINKGSELNNLQTAFTSDYHTADLIPVFAYGPGAEAFAGIYENTAIYTKMMKAFGWPSTPRD